MQNFLELFMDILSFLPHTIEFSKNPSPHIFKICSFSNFAYTGVERVWCGLGGHHNSGWKKGDANLIINFKNDYEQGVYTSNLNRTFKCHLVIRIFIH